MSNHRFQVIYVGSFYKFVLLTFRLARPCPWAQLSPNERSQPIHHSFFGTIWCFEIDMHDIHDMHDCVDNSADSSIPS